VIRRAVMLMMVGVAVAFGLPSCTSAPTEAGVTVAWTRQFGTAQSDIGASAAAHPDGGVVIGARSNGAIATALGDWDGVLRRYDAPGAILWTVQFGTAAYDEVLGVAVAASGAVLAVGTTNGDLAAPQLGGGDAFVRMFAADGSSVIWADQFGTSEYEEARAVAIASTGVIAVVGWTLGALEGGNAGGSDAFVRVYDAAGVLMWQDQFGTAASDEGYAVAFDAAGGVLVSGFTGSSGFVRSYGASGALRWHVELGSGVYGIALTDGGIAIGGTVAAGGTLDGYVAVLDAEDGSETWFRTFGTDEIDYVDALAVRPDGTIAVGGVTMGALGGANAGATDAFVRAYGADGALLWTDHFGTASNDSVSGLAAGASAVYAVGTTSGSIAAPNAGTSDVFVRAYAP
jgi:hypothetical protein